MNARTLLTVGLCICLLAMGTGGALATSGEADAGAAYLTYKVLDSDSSLSDSPRTTLSASGAVVGGSATAVGGYATAATATGAVATGGAVIATGGAILVV